MNVATYVKFCKIGALSPDHSAPFDASANGFVMGEGCGILVLKRLRGRGPRRRPGVRRDPRDRRRSRRQGQGHHRPEPAGQVRALERAYAAAGLDPWRSTSSRPTARRPSVGDKVEVEALNAVIGAGQRGAPRTDPDRLGQVDDRPPEVRGGRGAVIKAALALHHGVLPPSLELPDRTAGRAVRHDPARGPDRARALARHAGRRSAGPASARSGSAARTSTSCSRASVRSGRLPASTHRLPPAPQPPAVRRRAGPAASGAESPPPPQAMRPPRRPRRSRTGCGPPAG